MNPSGVDPANIPALKPQNGSPDFSSPENRAALYIATSSILIALTVIAVTIKLYVRILIQQPGWDDAATVLAMIGQLAYTGIVVYTMDRGAGRHMWDVRLTTYMQEISLSGKLAIIQQPTLLATKLALFGTFYRIFAPKQSMRYAIYAGMTVCVIIYTIMMFLFIFIKNEVQLTTINKALGILNVVTDIYLFVVPLAGIFGLHMPLGRKFGVAAVFMTGLLAIVMSIISLVWRFQVSTTSADITWGLAVKFLTLTVEVDVGIICGCVPTFPKLFQKTGMSQWLSTKFRSLTSRLLRSRDTSHGSSNKDSAGHGSKPATNKGDSYIELQDVQSIHKLVSTDMTSSKVDSLNNDVV